MSQHLKVIFWHFELKNLNRLSEYEFNSRALSPIFYPKIFRSELQIHSKFFIIFYIWRRNLITASERSKGLLAYMLFSACVKWPFFGGRRFFSPCQDEFLKKCTKFTFGTTRAPWSHGLTNSYKSAHSSSAWHTHTTIVHIQLTVFTDESNAACEC